MRQQQGKQEETDSDIINSSIILEIKTCLGNLPISKDGEVIIPKGIKEIPDNAFCESNINVDEYAFIGCEKLNATQE